MAPGARRAGERDPDPTALPAPTPVADGHAALHVPDLRRRDAGAERDPGRRDAEPDAHPADPADRGPQGARRRHRPVAAALPADGGADRRPRQRAVDPGRRGRLALSVALLTVAGAMFTAGINTSAALQGATDQGVAIQGYDVEIVLNNPEPVRRLEATLGPLEGVGRVETWPMVPVALGAT